MTLPRFFSAARRRERTVAEVHLVDLTFSSFSRILCECFALSDERPGSCSCSALPSFFEETSTLFFLICSRGKKAYIKKRGPKRKQKQKGRAGSVGVKSILEFRFRNR